MGGHLPAQFFSTVCGPGTQHDRHQAVFLRPLFPRYHYINQFIRKHEQNTNKTRTPVKVIHNSLHFSGAAKSSISALGFFEGSHFLKFNRDVLFNPALEEPFSLLDDFCIFAYIIKDGHNFSAVAAVNHTYRIGQSQTSLCSIAAPKVQLHAVSFWDFKLKPRRHLYPDGAFVNDHFLRRIEIIARIFLCYQRHLDIFFKVRFKRLPYFNFYGSFLQS